MHNVGPLDRKIRLIAGLALALFALLPDFFAGAGERPYGIWHWAAAILGVALLFTAVIRVCPLYRLLGKSTAGPQP